MMAWVTPADCSRSRRRTEDDSCAWSSQSLRIEAELLPDLVKRHR